jgi:vanillate O-demethylase monooxygenase subunit
VDYAALDPNWWYPVAYESQLGSVPYATRLLGQDLVLWRSSDSTVAAAIDRCPHRGTKLSIGEIADNGCIVCPYHGFEFDVGGKCTRVPQLEKSTPVPRRLELSMLPCELKHGIVWVTLGKPRAEIPDYPIYQSEGVRHVACAPYTWHCAPDRMVENFMDFAHLGYLHDGLLGSRDDPVVPDHHVVRIGTTLNFELTMEVPATEEFSVTAVKGSRGKQTNSYIVFAPYTIYLRSYYHDTGVSRFLFFSVQPVDEGVSTGFCYQSRDFGLDLPDDQFSDFQAVLAEQDRPIVESQTPLYAPLDLRAEVQMPFDKVTVAYRRLLSDLWKHPEGTIK